MGAWSCGTGRQGCEGLNGTEAGVFGPDDLDGLVAFFGANGYATLRGAFDPADLEETEAELVEAQRAGGRGGKR